MENYNGHEQKNERTEQEKEQTALRSWKDLLREILAMPSEHAAANDSDETDEDESDEDNEGIDHAA